MDDKTTPALGSVCLTTHSLEVELKFQLGMLAKEEHALECACELLLTAGYTSLVRHV